jgi:hypothetical protein
MATLIKILQGKLAEFQNNGMYLLGFEDLAYLNLADLNSILSQLERNDENPLFLNFDLTQQSVPIE